MMQSGALFADVYVAIVPILSQVKPRYIAHLRVETVVAPGIALM